MSRPPESSFCPLETRYGRARVRALFDREARLRRTLRVEAALAAAEAELGMIPTDAAREIERAAEGPKVTLERMDALEAELKHDVMAMTRALAEAAGPAGRWVHFGATSADITDTALAMELDESRRILRDDLTALIRALVDLATRHRATPELGRTHGQWAVPLSFGYKMAVTAAEFLRHRDRLDELTPRLVVGKISGAVGTGAGFGARAVEVEERTLARLGLRADEGPTQIVARDRIAEFTNWMALTAASLERVATEIRNLQRTEIGEVAEPFDERRQVGSSTMAQKRNPMLSENVTSLTRLIRALALPPLENMIQWHERDLSNSANERIVLPHGILLLDDTLDKMTRVIDGLHVDAGRMAANIAGSRGTAMTENLMLALTTRGLPRSDAHELMRNLTREGEGPAPLGERAARDPRVTELLTSSEISELLDPARYVEAAALKCDRLIARIRPRLET
ncbi:MAG: adenylosuccinate lyase [Thermoplasmata archaeon]